jgi:crotonobetainyl-CoA:carnitine CoA-transferase CaiB-like acyl-CoA transferase
MPIAALPQAPSTLPVLRGLRVLSLALNVPGPVALLRLKAMGAHCVKAEPPAPKTAPPGVTGDPMSVYSPGAYALLQEGLDVLQLDLKSPAGQAALHAQLAQTDVLLTAFRPSALAKLGLDWASLHLRYPHLSQVAIVGAPGARAEEAGHDLTYQADSGMIQGLNLPTSLFADMGGSLLATEAVLKAVLTQRLDPTNQGVYQEVALSDAATWLAMPCAWELTQPDGWIGGAHAGYAVYPCLDGRVALAALEPHFAQRLCAALGLPMTGFEVMFQPETRTAIAEFFSKHSRAHLDKLAHTQDIPLHTLAP